MDNPEMDADTKRTIARLRAELQEVEAEIVSKQSKRNRLGAAIQALELLCDPPPADLITGPERPPRTRRHTQQDTECPLTEEELKAMGDKYDALYAIARAMPERVIHVRTTCGWIINAGLMPDHMDNARVAITSHLNHRPEIWEKIGRGTYRLIATEE